MRGIVVGVIVGLLGGGRAWAQTGAAPVGPGYTLTDLLTRADAGGANLDLVGAAAGLDAANARLVEARLGRFPILALAGRLAYAPLKGYDPAASNGGEVLGQVVARLPIYDGGRLRNAVRGAELDVAGRTLDRRLLRRELGASLRTAYAQRLADADLLALHRELFETARELTLVARSRQRGGIGSPSEVARREVELTAARADVLDDSTRLADGERQIGLLLGFTEQEPFRLDTTGVEADLSRPLPTPGDSSSIETQQAALDLTVARNARALVQLERRPLVTLDASAGWWSTGQTLIERPDPGRLYLGGSVGVTVDWSLGLWGVSATRLAAGDAAVRVAEARLRSAERSRTVAIVTARAKIDRLRRVEAIQQAAYDQARVAYRLTLAAQIGGGATATEAFESRQLLLTAGTALISTQLDRRLSQIDLIRLGE